MLKNKGVIFYGLLILIFILGLSKRGLAEFDAEKTSFVLYGGYAQVAFTELEDHYRELGRQLGQDFINYLVLTGSSGSVEHQVVEVQGGIQIGGEVVYWGNETVGLAGRLNILIPETLSVEVSGSGRFSEKYEYKSQLSSYLLSPMLALYLKNQLAPGLELDFQIGAGVGLSSATIEQSERLVDPLYGINSSMSSTMDLSGMNFQLLAGANLGWRITEKFSLFANVGYNYCEIGEMKFYEGYDTNGDGLNDIKKDDIYGDPATQRAYNFDFSGLFFGGGISFKL